MRATADVDKAAAAVLALSFALDRGLDVHPVTAIKSATTAADDGFTTSNTTTLPGNASAGFGETGALPLQA